MFIQVFLIEENITGSVDVLVASCPACFLNIILERIRYFIMDDQTDIFFIHSHSEGRSSYHNLYVAGDKIILVFCLILNVHFPVKSGNRKSILFQACCQFGSCTGTGDINNGRTAFLLDNISQTIVFFIFLIPLENLILQVGPADVATEQFETDI